MGGWAGGQEQMSGVAEDSVLMPHGSGSGNLVGMRMRVRNPLSLTHLHPVLVLRMGPAHFLLLKLSHDHPTTCRCSREGHLELGDRTWLTLLQGRGLHIGEGGVCTRSRPDLHTVTGSCRLCPCLAA